MRRLTMLLVILFAFAVPPVLAEQTVASTPVPGGVSFGSLRPGALIFDQGPSTGVYGGCWSNQTAYQNFADQATLVDPVEIDEIRVFTCNPPLAGTVHLKILTDDGSGNPAGVVYAEDKTPDAWVADPVSGGYVVSVILTTPFQANAGTTYWYGISHNVEEMGQHSVVAPGDGTMAQFEGSVFSFHATVGDQSFQLMGTVVPVELQSIAVE